MRYRWADGTTCDEDELESYLTFMSDDYEEIRSGEDQMTEVCKGIFLQYVQDNLLQLGDDVYGRIMYVNKDGNIRATIEAGRPYKYRVCKWDEKPLTVDEQINFIRSKGKYCPHCGSGGLTYSGLRQAEFDPGYIHADIICDQCGSLTPAEFKLHKVGAI